MEDGGVVLMDLLWSDPTTNDGVEGVQPSPRGPGLVTFGPDRVKEFCKVCPYIPTNPDLVNSLTTALLAEVCSVPLDRMSAIPSLLGRSRVEVSAKAAQVCLFDFCCY